LQNIVGKIRVFTTYKDDFDGADDVHGGGERSTRVEEHPHRATALGA
jgi:hypothetical protein